VNPGGIPYTVPTIGRDAGFLSWYSHRTELVDVKYTVWKSRTMIEVLISLGSNVEKEKNTSAALQALEAQPAIEIKAVSSIYETKAIGADGIPSHQEDFHNAAVLIETDLTAYQLRCVLRAIEEKVGRVRSTDKFAARPIDLDIALYGDVVLSLEGSQIPDPDIVRFPHVAVPLADVAPEWIHPLTGDTLDQIAQRLATSKTEDVIV
jgi:2-amino-4-hydroxy-6-hydroxymethyldihydropteridine diphosphokinase